jgi:hypothetical protein
VRTAVPELSFAFGDDANAYFRLHRHWRSNRMHACGGGHGSLATQVIIIVIAAVVRLGGWSMRMLREYR